MDSVIESLKCVCGYYRLFVLKKDFQIYAIDNYLILNFITSRLLTFSYINYYAIFDNNICLYLIYSRLFLLRNQPKFGILNSFPHGDCQLYPFALADFSIVKNNCYRSRAFSCVYS